MASEWIPQWFSVCVALELRSRGIEYRSLFVMSYTDSCVREVVNLV